METATAALSFGDVEERQDYRNIPQTIFEAALLVYLEGQRLDMQELAASLGISRATLYRHARNRDHLLGTVIWYLMQKALQYAIDKTAALKGADRIREAARVFMFFIHEQVPFQRFLHAEPEAALRILTSKKGRIQSGLVDLIARELEKEVAENSLKLSLEPHVLAYTIVRIGESFLYADLIADNEPNIELAVELISKLLQTEELPDITLDD